MLRSHFKSTIRAVFVFAFEIDYQFELCVQFILFSTLNIHPHKRTGTYQAIHGNDQIASPTNQKTAGSELDRTSQLIFYGSLRHLESFSGGFLCEYVCWDVFSDTC